MEHTLVAVFDNRNDAQKALEDLVASGFSRQQVRLSEGDPVGQASQAGSSVSGIDSDAAGKGEGLGATFKNFFSDLFGTDRSEHAQMYSEAVNRGHYVLSLTASGEAEIERGADIVERYGPIDIDEQAQQWQTGGMGAGAGGAMGAMGAGAQQSAQSQSQQSLSQQSLSQQSGAGMSQQFAQGETQGAGLHTDAGSIQGATPGATMQGSQQRAEGTAIPVIQEEIKVGKREVQRGGVRVYQRMVETPVTESIDLREEHVNVQRRAVDKLVDPADIAAFQDSTIELRETAEEAVVEKTARVVEEVVVGKEVTQREQQISDTVRHTEVEIEQLTPDDDAYFRGHWNSNFASAGGTYEDYAPAYRYGSTMARSDLYRGRPWNDVENNLRMDWEGRSTGSTWEQIKAAVRHGWERMTS